MQLEAPSNATAAVTGAEAAKNDGVKEEALPEGQKAGSGPAVTQLGPAPLAPEVEKREEDEEDRHNFALAKDGAKVASEHLSL